MRVSSYFFMGATIMMTAIPVSVLILLLWLHFISDFLFQVSKIAMYKTNNSKIVLAHCVLYAIPFVWFGVTFAIITFALHYLIDAVMPRICYNFWIQDKKSEFFTCFGLDQISHTSLLIGTYAYVGNTDWVLTTFISLFS